MNEGIVFEGSLKRDCRVFRYMSLGQFMTMVEYNKTYLTKIDQWEDTWEVPGSKVPMENEYGKLELPKDPALQNLYGQCWSLNGYSDALWRIYSPRKDGIQIQTTVEKLCNIENLKKGMVAPVIYYDNLKEALRTIEKNEHYKIFSEGFLKRRAFEHEEEVRLITMNDEECMDKKYKDDLHIEFKIDTKELIEDIQVDPRASDWYVNVIKQYCARAGLVCTPQKSDLYAENIFEKSRLVRQIRI